MGRQEQQCPPCPLWHVSLWAVSGAHGWRGSWESWASGCSCPSSPPAVREAVGLAVDHAALSQWCWAGACSWAQLSPHLGATRSPAHEGGCGEHAACRSWVIPTPVQGVGDICTSSLAWLKSWQALLEQAPKLQVQRVPEPMPNLKHIRCLAEEVRVLKAKNMLKCFAEKSWFSESSSLASAGLI